MRRLPRVAARSVHSAGSVVLRHPWLVPACAPFGLLLWAVLWHRVLAPGDGLLYYLPVHQLDAEALRAGHLPVWNPFQFSGSPLLATGQPAPFYPLELAFLALPPLLANNLYVVCTLSIASTGAFFLARRLTGDAVAATVGALAFVSCGFMYGHIEHQSVLATTAWLPWGLWAVDRLRERISTGRAVALAALLGLALLAGQPQMFILIVAVLATYVVAHLMLEDAHERRLLAFLFGLLALVVGLQLAVPVTAVRALAFPIFIALLLLSLFAAGRLIARRRPPIVWVLPLAIAAAAGAGAAQLLPVAMVVGETSRASLSYTDAVSYSFPGSHLALLLFPQLFGGWSAAHPYDGKFNVGELSAYPGAASLVLAAAGLARVRRDARALALAVAAALALLVALGRTTSFSILVWLAPVVGQFRSWGRYAVVLDLALAVGAAFGVAALRSHTERAAASRRAIGAAVLVTVAGLVLPLLPSVGKYAVSGGARVHALAPPICAALAAAGCAILFRRQPRLAVILCGVLVIADGLISFGIGSDLARSPTVAAARGVYSPARAASWGPIDRTAGGIDRYVYLGTTNEPPQPYFPQATDLKGIRSATGYDPLAPRAYLSVVGLRQDGGSAHPGHLLERPGWILDLLRVSTIVVQASDLPPRMSHRFTLRGRAGALSRYSYTPRLDDAFLVGAAHDGTHSTAVAGIQGTTGFDPRREAVLEGCPGCDRVDDAGPAGVVLREHREGAGISLEIDARRAAALVVSEAWFPGWTAFVDGHEVPVHRADALLLGVLVPPGRHQVTLRYVAPGAHAGIAISSAFLLVLAGAPLVRRLRLRRRASAQRS
jgi:Bacterial membrane protein YfhO